MEGVIGGNRPPVIGDRGPPPGVKGNDGGGIEMREGCKRNPCGGLLAAFDTVVGAEGTDEEETLVASAGVSSSSGSGSAQPRSK